MEIKKRPTGVVFIGSSMILSGMVMFIVSAVGLVDPEIIADHLGQIPFVPKMLFYFLFSPEICVKLLSLRLALALCQIVAGIFFLVAKKWALYLTRALILFGLAATFVNPYYPRILVYFSLLWYALVIFYLYYYRTEEKFEKGFMENYHSMERGLSEIEADNAKSVGILLLGIVEIILGLYLLRVSLWNLSLQGESFEVVLRLGMSQDIVISKLMAIIGSLILFMAGILTIGLKSAGRMLTSIICIATLVGTCIYALVVDHSKMMAMFVTKGSSFIMDHDKMEVFKFYYVIVIIFSLVYSCLWLILLNNPRIKLQFFKKSRFGGFGSILKMSGVLAGCFFLYIVIGVAMDKFPGVFERTEEATFMVGVQEEESSKELWERLSQEFMSSYRHKQYGEAEILGKRALKVAEEVFGGHHPNLTVSLNNLGLLYFSAKRYDEGEVYLKRALKIDSTFFGEEDPKVATDLNNLAELYKAKGSYIEAEKYYQQALKISEKVYGPDHMQVRIIRGNLADLYEDNNFPGKSEAFH